MPERRKEGKLPADQTSLRIVQGVFAGPGPVIHPETEPFWTALGEGQFLVQRCASCGTRRFPIAPVCHACLTFAFEWEALPSAGNLQVAVLVSRASAAWEGAVPFTVGLVNMAYGIRLAGRIFCQCGAGSSPGAPLELCSIPAAKSGYVYAYIHKCWEMS